jgi:hypothetical protein
VNILIMVALVLAGCQIPGAKPAAPTQVPDLAYTQAAETIVAQLTSSAPTATLAPPEPTLAPPPVEMLQPTQPPPTEIPLPTSTPEPVAPTEPAVVVTPTEAAPALPTGAPTGVVVLATATLVPPYSQPYTMPPYQAFPQTVPTIPATYVAPAFPPYNAPYATPYVAPYPTPVYAVPYTGTLAQPAFTATLPTVQPIPWRLAFQDNFEGSMGWTVETGKNYKMGYDMGGYRMYADFDNDAIYSVKTTNYGDVRVEIDAARLGGPFSSYYGLTCRFQNGGNYYSLVLTGDGSFAILKKLTGKFYTLAQSQAPSTAINRSTAYNRMQIECVGPTLTLSVNGQVLLQARDYDFPAGYVGMIAGNQRESGMDALFDNIAVLTP